MLWRRNTKIFHVVAKIISWEKKTQQYCYLQEEALLDNQLLNNNKLQVMNLIVHVAPKSNKIVSNVVLVMYYLQCSNVM